MFLGYRARAVICLGHGDTKRSLAKPRMNQNWSAISRSFTKFGMFTDFQVYVWLNSRKTFSPHAGSLASVQIVTHRTKIRSWPVLWLRDPIRAIKECDIYDNDASNLLDACGRCRAKTSSDFLQPRMHFLKRGASVCLSKAVPRQPLRQS